MSYVHLFPISVKGGNAEEITPRVKRLTDGRRTIMADMSHVLLRGAQVGSLANFAVLTTVAFRSFGWLLEQAMLTMVGET